MIIPFRKIFNTRHLFVAYSPVIIPPFTFLRCFENDQTTCFSSLERFLVLNKITTKTAHTITKVLMMAAIALVLQLVQAVVKLNNPCQMAIIKIDPPVLLKSQVKMIAPAKRPINIPGMIFES